MYQPTSSVVGRTHSHSKRQQPKIILTHGRARMPSKVRGLPHIYSLSLISRKNVSEDEVGKVTVFEVGITFDLPRDLSFQIMANPALIAHGYLLPTGITFIRSKTPLVVQLYKFREGPDLELPYEGIYLIPHRLDSVIFERVETSQRVPRDSFEVSSRDTSPPLDFFQPDNLNTLS